MILTVKKIFEESAFTIDALPPAKMAEKAEDVGVTKANMDFFTTLTPAILAGAFIGLGALFSTTVGGAFFVGFVYWLCYRRKQGVKIHIVERSVNNA